MAIIFLQFCLILFWFFFKDTLPFLFSSPTCISSQKVVMKSAKCLIYLIWKGREIGSLKVW